MRKDLYLKFEETYKGAAFVIASNELPASEAQGRDTQFQKDVWQPLCTRVDFSYMLHTHEDQEFPYTANQLAHALWLISRHSDCLCEHMKKFDNLAVPDFNDCSAMESRDEWYHRVEKQQEDAFE